MSVLNFYYHLFSLISRCRLFVGLLRNRSSVKPNEIILLMPTIFPRNHAAHLEWLLEIQQRRFDVALRSDMELEELKEIRQEINQLKDKLIRARSCCSPITDIKTDKKFA